MQINPFSSLLASSDYLLLTGMVFALMMRSIDHGVLDSTFALVSLGLVVTGIRLTYYVPFYSRRGRCVTGWRRVMNGVVAISVLAIFIFELRGYGIFS